MQNVDNPRKVETYEFARRRQTRYRWMRVILVGCLAFLFLLCIIGLLFWILNPGQLNRNHNGMQLLAWFFSPAHLLLTSISLLVLLVCPFLIAKVSGKPAAILFYVLDIQHKEKSNRKLYTLLTSLNDVDQAPQNAPESHDRDAQPPLQKVGKHLLILGLPGAGKTKTLLAFQYDVLKKWWKLLWGHEKVPVYVQMNSYNPYLKQQVTLVNYVIYESGSTGISHLRPYLAHLLARGQVVLLFDGVNEVDSTHLIRVCEELKQLMAEQRNRIIVTCRDIDFREQDAIKMLVADGYAQKKLLLPLRVNEIEGFIQRYIDAGYVDEDKKITWRYTAQEIRQKIDQSGLSQYCTNPLILYTMMRTINGTSADREILLNTRGRLLREFVFQLIEATANKPNWRREPPDKQEIVWQLGAIACNARRIHARNAIRLVYESPITGGKTRKIPIEELAGSLPSWLENPNPDPDIYLPTLEDLHLQPLPVEYDTVQWVNFLRFTREATLIRVDDNGEIRFRHELIAEYFVAEYLNALDEKNQHSTIPFIDEILENQASWSQPLALWAGMLPDPKSLAQRLAASVQQPLDAKSRNALALSLTCIGVVWKSPRSQQTPNRISLPQNLADALRKALPHEKIRKDLAPIIRKSAEEGGIEIYHALLSLLSSPGAGQLLHLIGDPSIRLLLFDYVQEIVDKPAYAKHLEGSIRALGHFGKDAIPEALQLSSPTTTNNNLRRAAIKILGYMAEPVVIETLIAYLSENTLEQTVLIDTASVLFTFGTEHVLEPLTRDLQNPTTPLLAKIRMYSILREWIQHIGKQKIIDLTLYERLIELLVLFMESRYPGEIKTDGIALLLSQVTPLPPDRRWTHVIKILLQHLSTDDIELELNIITTLKRMGSIATPQLRECLGPRTPEVIRLRVIDICKDERPPEALPDLLRLLGDPTQKIQEKVKLALKHYAPESISGLIQCVLSPDASNMVVLHAAEVLKSIGNTCVLPITQTLANAAHERVRVLVRVLVHIHDFEAVPAIIDLLKASSKDTGLTFFLVEEACSQFADERVVAALIELLQHTEPSLQHAISKTLSLIGHTAYRRLFTAFDVEPTTVSPTLHPTAYIREALITMKPFPMSQLFAAFANCTNAQAWHISQVFLAKDVDSAVFLVNHLCDPNARTQEHVRHTLDQMRSHVLVPPLLDALQHGTSCPLVATYLLKFPESIPQLVHFLGNGSSSQSSYDVLIKFGPRVIPHLLPALEEQNQRSLRQAKNLIVAYTQQDKKNLLAVIRLFAPIALQSMINAREALLDVLVHDLAEQSIEPLLDELGTSNLQVREGIADALARLAREYEKRRVQIKNELLKSLFDSDLRGGAEIVLIKMKELIVEDVWQLVTDKNVGESAQHILSEIGTPAFHLIWAAYSNRSTPELREAAKNIFRAMATTQIQEELVDKLTGEKREDIEMAFTLLTERIHDDTLSTQRQHEMIPALLEYVQAHKEEDKSRRILAFLLLQQKNLVIKHMLQKVQLQPRQVEWLIPSFLLLGMAGTDAKEALHNLLLCTNTPSKLTAQINSALGMMEANPEVVKNARSIGYVTQLEQQEVALHALGGLLAGGKWNAAALESLRNNSNDVTTEHELFSLLLGMPYAPRLQTEMFEHRRDVEQRDKVIRTLEQNISTLEQKKTQIEQEKAQRERQVRQISNEKNDLTTKLNEARQATTEVRQAKTKAEEERDEWKSKVRLLEIQVASLTSQNLELRRMLPNTTRFPH